MQYDIKYHVDEKNKVVVATADFSGELDRLFDKKFAESSELGIGIKWRPFSLSDFYRPKGYYRVVARCHKDDVFDEETGKKICRQKLKEKFYGIFNCIVKRYHAYLIKCASATEEYIKNIR